MRSNSNGIRFFISFFEALLILFNAFLPYFLPGDVKLTTFEDNFVGLCWFLLPILLLLLFSFVVGYFGAGVQKKNISFGLWIGGVLASVFVNLWAINDWQFPYTNIHVLTLWLCISLIILLPSIFICIMRAAYKSNQ